MTLMLTGISLVNITNVQAADIDQTVTANQDTTKVSLENIRDIVIENNLDLKILDNKLKIAKENRDDTKDTFEAKPKPGDAPSSSDSKYATDDANHTAYKADLQNYNTNKAAYDSAKAAYEKAKEDYKTAKTNYDQKVESAVYNAQNAYVTYLNDLSTSKINQDTVNYNTKKAEIYKIQYENGFISKNQYIKNLQGNTSTNDLNKSTDTEELDRVKLCNLLGISPEEKVIFNTDITVDFQVIAKINYEKDLQEMLDNSLDIKTKSDNVDDLNDEDIDTDVHDYEVDNAEIELKQAINNAETDFKGTYNDLMASYNSLKNSYDKIIQEQNEFKITETQYDYGYMSKNALDNAQITLDKDNASFIKTRNECYLKYLKYIEMKEGY
jgi:outer membrane protein TolC